MRERVWDAGRSVDVRATLWPVVRGTGDPAHRFDAAGRFWGAWATPSGAGNRLPASRPARSSRPGHGARVPTGCSTGCPPCWASSTTGRGSTSSSVRPLHEARRRKPGLRLVSTGLVVDALVPAVLEQKVTGEEARRSWRLLLRRYGTAGARAGRGSDRPAVGGGAAGRAQLGLAPLRRRPEAAAHHPGGCRGRPPPRGVCRHDAGGGDGPAATDSRHRALDRRGDGAACARPPRRGECRRLPPAEHGGAPAHRPGPWHRRRDAGAVGPVGRSAAAGDAAGGDRSGSPPPASARVSPTPTSAPSSPHPSALHLSGLQMDPICSPER